MACVPIPQLPMPSLPAGISLDPPIPVVEFDTTLCCKLLAFSPKPPPLPFAVVLNPAIQAAITAALQGVTDFIDSLPLDCPRE